MHRLVVDLSTGETSEVPLTESEMQESGDTAQDYRLLRRMAYPDFAEYLDGIVKGDSNQIQAYKAACLAVKAKYPKPDGE